MAERWSIAYRPKRFKQVLGQSHVVEFFKVVLNNWYEESVPLPVGALFGGYSGVGKTTIARIIAASLNCRQREGAEPCGSCESCKQIINGAGGILEIDAAFFGLVENVRNLRDRLSSYSFADYQVVILDECHMMSRESFNVLLKLLEEPPEKLFFILITTEIHKVLDTIRSRLLEFRFKLVRWDAIHTLLRGILKKEKVTCSDELLLRMYKMLGNNLRDLIVTLEQLSILGNKEITEDLVKKICGDVYLYDKIFKAITVGSFDKAIELYDEHLLSQPDFTLFLQGFAGYLGDKFKESLKTGSSDSLIYSAALKFLYRFLSIRLNWDGAAASRLLFSQMIEVGGITKGRSERISADEAVSLLTTPPK